MMLLCIAALWSIEFSQRKLATIFIVPVVFGVVTTILGWVFGWSLSFGYTLLGDPSAPASWFPPRAAIDAMIPSALASFVILFLSFERSALSAVPYAWATGALLIAAPPVRLLTFATLSPSALEYLTTRPIEIAVTFALMTLGVALIVTRYVGSSLALSRGTRWRSLMLITAIAATLELWYAVRAAEIRQLRSDVEFAIEESARAYRAGLAENGTSADLLWQRWRNQHWQIPDQIFLSDAGDYMRSQHAVLAMGMFDAHGRLLRLARRDAEADAMPTAQDRIILGATDDLMRYGSSESAHANLVDLALASKARQRIAPTITVDRTELVDVVSPVYDFNGEPLGAFLLLYRRDLGVSRILEEIAPDFHIRLYIENRLVFDRPARDGIDPRELRFQAASTRTFTSPVRYTFEIAPGQKIIDRALGITPLLVLLFAWVSLLLLMFALYNERRVQSLFQDRERILDESLDIICTLDENGRYVTVNEASTRILGYRPVELIGQPYVQYAHPGDVELLNGLWREAKANIRVPSVPLRFLHRSGRAVYLQGNTHWSPNEALFYCDMRDVTAEYESLVQRQHAENTFRIGVAQAGCGVYEYQPAADGIEDGAIIWVGAIRALTGYEPDELSALGFKGWMELIHPDDAAHVRQILQRCLETRQPHTVDYRLKRKDGSYVPVLDRGRHLADDNLPPRMIGALIDLTAIRQQENALRRSEERYRIIANQVGAVIIERETASGRIRVFGPAEQIFGYTKEQLESRPLNRNDTMIHPDDRAHFFAAVDEAERTLSSYYVEHRRRHRGGHYIYIASRGVVLPGPDGRAEREVIAITDISERRLAESRLQENEERFRLAAEQAGQIVYEFIFGDNMQIAELRFAGAAEKVTGYTALELRELQTQDRYFLVHPDDIPLVRATRANDVREAQQYVVEHRMRHRDGHYVHVENRGAVKRDAAGNVVGIVGMLLDVTSRRAAEADRQQYTAQLHALAEIAHKVGSMLSVHELLKYLTASMRELLGVNAAAAMVHDTMLAPTEVVAVSYAEHYGLQRSAPALLSPSELHEQVRNDNGPRRFTAKQMAEDPNLAGLTQHDDLRHPLRGWMGAPLIARDGANFGLIEISDKIEGEFTESDLQVLNQLAGLASVAIENIRLYATLEERVTARTRELEISNRELEAFSYSVSHDLRAPLRAIAGFSSILETEHSGSLEGPARRYLQRITAGVERMANLIDDLLSLARVSRADLKRETVDVSALCKAIVKRQMERYANRNVDVVIDSRMKAIADPRLVEVALENLVENALKFTGTRAEAKIHIGHRRVDGRPVFYVADNGVGFDPKYASNLFGVFQRLHSASDFPGTGVGLATVQRIVQRHHGRIWAEAESDEGATFYFTLANEA
jgi:PAS domain S-box-containing protein